MIPGSEASNELSVAQAIFRLPRNQPQADEAQYLCAHETPLHTEVKKRYETNDYKRYVGL